MNCLIDLGFFNLQESRSRGNSFAAVVGHHQQPADGGGPLQHGHRLLRRLELRHHVSRLLSRLLCGSLLLLSQRRGN